MRRLLIYAIQVVAVAMVGYLAWYVLYGGPDMSLSVWLLICILAAALGLVPYVLSGLLRRKRSHRSDLD